MSCRCSMMKGKVNGVEGVCQCMQTHIMSITTFKITRVTNIRKLSCSSPFFIDGYILPRVTCKLIMEISCGTLETSCSSQAATTNSLHQSTPLDARNKGAQWRCLADVASTPPKKSNIPAVTWQQLQAISDDICHRKQAN